MSQACQWTPPKNGGSPSFAFRTFFFRKYGLNHAALKNQPVVMSQKVAATSESSPTLAPTPPGRCSSSSRCCQRCAMEHHFYRQVLLLVIFVQELNKVSFLTRRVSFPKNIARLQARMKYKELEMIKRGNFCFSFMNQKPSSHCCLPVQCCVWGNIAPYHGKIKMLKKASWNLLSCTVDALLLLL